MTGALADGATYRKYCAYIETQMKINGASDYNHKTVVYEVGRRADSYVRALLPAPGNVYRFDASFSTGHVIADTMTGLAKKYSNFIGIFDKVNLAGVVERLAKGLACAGTYNLGPTALSLAGGADVKISALSTLFTPVSAHIGKVFIPRIVDTVIHPDVFYVLTCAVAGEGGEVVTDHLEIDASTRAVLFTNVSEGRLATAIVDALRMLGSLFAACGQGDLFACATVKGINAVNSLVAHSDEGGVMRDIMRNNGFAVPFKCIYPTWSEYVGLPALSTTNKVSVAAYADSILLKAGALVAHCNPGTVLNGSWFPSLHVAKNDDESYNLPGEESASPPDAPAQHRSAIEIYPLVEIRFRVRKRISTNGRA